MRSALSRVAGVVAELAGAMLRTVGQVLPGLAGLGLVSYGAWLWWRPAGFIAAGVLLLADRVWEQARAGRERS
ncbi:hypothetical protein ACNF49_14070 [Actinomadura sp. ATCC 39365]